MDHHRRGGGFGGGPTRGRSTQRRRQQQEQRQRQQPPASTRPQCPNDHHRHDYDRHRRHSDPPPQPQPQPQQPHPPTTMSQHANPYGQRQRGGGGGAPTQPPMMSQHTNPYGGGGGGGTGGGYGHGNGHRPGMTAATASSSSSHPGGFGRQRQPVQQPQQQRQPSAAEEELRRQIARLQSQVESQDETIFELSASVSAAEAESSHRATQAESAAAARVREMEEQVQRYREEANVSMARLASVMRQQKQNKSSSPNSAVAVSPPLGTGSNAASAAPSLSTAAAAGAGREDQDHAASKVAGDEVVAGARGAVAGAARVSTSPENEGGRLGREAAVAAAVATPAAQRRDGEDGGEAATTSKSTTAGGGRKRGASSAFSRGESSSSDAAAGSTRRRIEGGDFGAGSGFCGGVRGLAMHLMLRHDDIVSELLLLERREDDAEEGGAVSSPPPSAAASRAVAGKHAARGASSSAPPPPSSPSPSSSSPSSSSFLDGGLSRDAHALRAALRTILSSGGDVGAVSIRRLVRTAVDASLVGFRRLTESLDEAGRREDSSRERRRRRLRQQRHGPQTPATEAGGGERKGDSAAAPAPTSGRGGAVGVGDAVTPPPADDGNDATPSPPPSSPARGALRLLHMLRFLGLVLSASAEGRDVVRSLVASNYDYDGASPKIRVPPPSAMADKIAVPRGDAVAGGKRRCGGDGGDGGRGSQGDDGGGGGPQTKSAAHRPGGSSERIRGLPASRIAAASSALWRRVVPTGHDGGVSFPPCPGGDSTVPSSLRGKNHPPPSVIAWDEEEYDRTSRDLAYMIQALLLGGGQQVGRGRRQRKKMRMSPLGDGRLMPLLRMELMSLLRILTWDCDDVVSGRRVPSRGFWNVMYLLLFTRSRNAPAAAGCGPDNMERNGDDAPPADGCGGRSASKLGKLGSTATGNSNSSVTSICWNILDAVAILETPSSARVQSETSSSSSSSNGLALVRLKYAIVEFFARAMSAAAPSSSPSSPGASRWSTEFVIDHGGRVVTALSRDIREILALLRSFSVNDGTDESSRPDRKRLRSGRDCGMTTATGTESPSYVLPSSVFFKTNVRFAILAVELMTAYCHHRDDGIHLLLQQKKQQQKGRSGTRSFDATHATIGAALTSGSSSCIDVIVDLLDLAVSSLLFARRRSMGAAPPIDSVGSTTWYPNVLGRLIRSILALFSRVVTCANSLHTDEEVDQLNLLAMIRNRKDSFCSNCYLIAESDCCGYIDEATRQDARRLIHEIALDEQDEELAVTALRLTS